MMATRHQMLERLRQQPQVPVLIVGGGINGVGLLRELALQGVRCVLVDRADFSAGATSKSSRMIHGGLRYLENREFALVEESLQERNRLLTNAPHFVSPLKTTIPLYSRLGGFLRSGLIFCGLKVRPGSRGALITRLGLIFYDFVTRKNRRTPVHYFSGRAQSLREVPGLDPHIVATANYWDARITEAERLGIELIRDALAAQPDCLALNYVAPQRLDDGRIILQDLAGGEQIGIEPRLVINATGAWVDRTNRVLGLHTHFMGGTKGSHLVVDCPQLFQALGDRMVYYQHADGRVCIVFAFMNRIIMGSTDIPLDDPDSAECDEGEIDYMLQTLRGVFPGIEVSRKNIVYTFCGVRPLPACHTGVTANISRGHTIHVIDPEGLRSFPIYCLIGGKWTTFRALAEQTADRVLSQQGLPRRCPTQDVPIGGGKDYPADEQTRTDWIRRVAEATHMEETRVKVLLERYGTAAETYLDGADTDRPLRSLPGYSVGEIQRIAAEEWVVHLADLVYRRTTIGLLGYATDPVLVELAEVVGDVLGWDAARREQEVALARPRWQGDTFPPVSGRLLAQRS
jgi:glycerol-3-phosphate dehydrogenase